MAGRHRKPVPASPLLVPLTVGALGAAVVVVATTAVAPPTLVAKASPTRAVVVAPVLLPLPPLTPAAAALYLAPLPPASVHSTAPTELVERAAVVTKPEHVTEQRPATQVKTETVGITGGGVTARAVAAALGQTGVPYVYGGNTPGGGLDCSSLVQYAYRSAGLTLPRTAAEQATMGRPVQLSAVKPGDLLTYNYGGGITHVALAIGGGMIVEASQPGHPVATRKIYTSNLATVRRLVG